MTTLVTMTAIRLDARREESQRLELCTDIPIASQPGHDNVIIKVNYAGVCGTDLHVIKGTIPAAHDYQVMIRYVNDHN